MPKQEDFKLINFGAEHMPERQHPEDAGMDIYAPATFHVPPHESVYVSCGFGIIMPPGYMAYTVVRGSTANMGLHIAENPIDSNYRGEVHAVVWNIGNETVVIEKGKRFCQLVIVPCTCSAIGSLPRLPQRLSVVRPEEVTPTDRGDGGYGSTDGTGTPYIIPIGSICGGGGADTSKATLYDNDKVFVMGDINKCGSGGSGADRQGGCGVSTTCKASDHLDHAGEVVTLKVLGKPTPINMPFARKNGQYDITSTYDPDDHSVTVYCAADIVTLGITAKVLQHQYMDACKGLNVDIMAKIHRVIEEVCSNGQN